MEPNYQEMKNSLTRVDSISKYIIATYDKLKDSPKISCIIGLVAEPNRLHDVRKNRLTTIRENRKNNYTNLETIQEEVDKSKKTFKKYQWPIIDVTRKSVEETAASIIKIHEIY